MLMVAKLDPDAAKPEQRTQPRDAPACKTPPPATDPGGGKKGGTPGTPRGPQGSTKDTATKAEKPRTEGVGDPGMVLLTKQGAGGKGDGAPQTKGLKGDELQGREGPGQGEQVETAEKGAEDPPSKMAKGNLSKDVGSEGKRAGAQIQVRKWGGPLGRRSKWDGPQSKKDKESVLPSKAEKSEEPQIKAEKGSKEQEKAGKGGDAPREVGKAGEPPSAPGKSGEPGAKVGKGQPQGESREAGEAAGKTEKGWKAPKEVGARGETPAAVEKEGGPHSAARKAGEPRSGAADGTEALETEVEGPRPPAREGPTERPRSQSRRESEEGPGLPEGSRGAQSEDSDQVRGCGPGAGRADCSKCGFLGPALELPLKRPRVGPRHLHLNKHRPPFALPWGNSALGGPRSHRKKLPLTPGFAPDSGWGGVVARGSVLLL